jgi:hypothetical protein
MDCTGKKCPPSQLRQLLTIDRAVVASSAAKLSLNVFSDGQLLRTIPLNNGLNSGVELGKKKEAQTLTITNSDNGIVMKSEGGALVSDGCPNGIYNMNYQVIPLVNGPAVATPVATPTTTTTPVATDLTSRLADVEKRLAAVEAKPGAL